MEHRQKSLCVHDVESNQAVSWAADDAEGLRTTFWLFMTFKGFCSTRGHDMDDAVTNAFQHAPSTMIWDLPDDLRNVFERYEILVTELGFLLAQQKFIFLHKNIVQNLKQHFFSVDLAGSIRRN